MKVEIVSSETVERKYVDKDGEERAIRGQLVYLHVPGKRYPVEMFRRLAKAERAGLPAGWYEFDDERFFVNYQFSRVEFSLSHLKPSDPPKASVPVSKAA